MQQIMRLYTRQHIASLNALDRDGFIRNTRQNIEQHVGDLADYFCTKYDYFNKMAERRVAKPAEAAYPIWCSISVDNCLKPIADTVVYVLDVPVDHIIYFDSVKWDYVLNDLYIPKNKSDEARFLAKLQARGIADQFSFLRGKYQGKYPDIERQVLASWRRIFDIDQWDAFRVQANIWLIEKNWIVRVINEGEIVS